MRNLKILCTIIIVVGMLGCAKADVNPNYPRAGFPAVYMKVWAVVYDDFMKIDDMPSDQKNLDIYHLEFGRDGDLYTVQFVSELVPEKMRRTIHRMALGRSMIYWVNVKTMKIEKRLFYAD